MNNIFNTEFTHCYFTCNTFKQKEANTLQWLICGKQLSNDIRFNGYGIISFDETNDACHRYPEIKIANDDGTPIVFNSRTTNCLVFDLPNTEKNPKYDKLFLYHTTAKNGQGVWYGWVAYNTVTQERLHKVFIDHDIQDLLLSLSVFFNNINRYEFLKNHLKQSRYLSKKYK